MDRKLVELLACPTTRQPLRLLDRSGVDALNRAIAEGGIRRGDGALQTVALDTVLVTADGRTGYRVDDGIPVLLAEDALDLTALAA